MPNGDVRPSHSANFFKVTGRLEEEINQRPKRLREENNPLPEIFIETPSTATLIEESNTVNPKFLSPETHNQKSRSYLAIKLNQRRSRTKYGNNKHDKLRRANHENIKKLWRIVENTTRHQSDPIGHIINLGKNTFTKGTFEILILYPHLKYTININSIKN